MAQRMKVGISWRELMNFVKGRETWLFLFFLIIYFSLLALWGINRPEPWHDEHHFVETVKYFGENFNSTALYNYEEMSTPLPFFIYAVWGKLAGFQLPVLRILSILVACLTFLVFFSIFKKYYNGLVALVVVPFFALNPYFAGASIFVFTDMMAILFLGLSFLGIQRGKPFLLGIALASALLTRQYLAFLVPAIFLYTSLVFLNSGKKGELKYLIAVVLSCVPLGLLMLFWGGSTPVNTLRDTFISYAFTFHPAFLTLYISQIFIYSFPFILFKWRKFFLDRKIVLISLLASVSYLLFPVSSSIPAIEVDVTTVGYFHRFLKMFLSDSMVHVVFYFAYLMSLPVLFTFISSAYSDFKQKRIGLRFLFTATLLFYLLVMPFSYLVWEKYFIPVLPVVVFLIMNDFRKEEKILPEKVLCRS